MKSNKDLPPVILNGSLALIALEPSDEPTGAF